MNAPVNVNYISYVKLSLSYKYYFQEIAETDENLDVDIEASDSEKPLPDPLATGNYVDPDELPDPLATGSYIDPSELGTKPAEKTEAKTSVSSVAEKPKQEEEMVEIEEFYVKYKNFSYLHCEWRTAPELELGDKRAGQKIKRFKTKQGQNVFETVSHFIHFQC